MINEINTEIAEAIDNTSLHENTQTTADTEAPADEIVDAENVDDAKKTISTLKDTIISLKTRISELESARDTQERILNELGEFNSLFPETSIDDIPESVWDSVKKGTSLAASYALYERRQHAEQQRKHEINILNASKSAGIAGKYTANEYSQK